MGEWKVSVYPATATGVFISESVHSSFANYECEFEWKSESVFRYHNDWIGNVSYRTGCTTAVTATRSDPPAAIGYRYYGNSFARRRIVYLLAGVLCVWFIVGGSSTITVSAVESCDYIAPSSFVSTSTTSTAFRFSLSTSSCSTSFSYKFLCDIWTS